MMYGLRDLSYDFDNDFTMTFVEAAYTILKSARIPLTVEEIVKRAMQKRLISPLHEKPSRTLRSCILIENRRKSKRGEQVRFRHYNENLWGLTELDSKYIIK